MDFLGSTTDNGMLTMLFSFPESVLPLGSRSFLLEPLFLRWGSGFLPAVLLLVLFCSWLRKKIRGNSGFGVVRMRTISDLPRDMLEEEIFSRVPISSLKSVRSTCKKWNSLCKNRIFFDKAEAEAARNQFTGFMMMDFRICLMKFDLQGILNNGDLVDPCVKQVSILDQIEICSVFHSEGLLLCVVEDKSRLSRLLVWNPYLGQTKWIKVEPRNEFHREDMYALGYDQNRNHKILRIFYEFPLNTRSFVHVFEIYDFRSDSWKVINVPHDWVIESQRCVSLKGSAYFSASKTVWGAGRELTELEYFLLCFDFTTETFGPRLPLPFNDYRPGVDVILSCVRGEQLAVLYQHWNRLKTVEIYLTDKIDPNAVSWRKFLKLPHSFKVNSNAGSFFIDEEKKIAVFFDIEYSEPIRYQTAYIIGEDGYFKSVDIREAPNLGPTMVLGSQVRETFCFPLVCSSYVPSLVQLKSIKQPGKLKECDSY